MIVRSDGSLMNVRTAAERPVETLLSGPAASVAGARFLCEAPDALVLDIGGTTSDTAVLHNGAVRIDPDGARVGHWRTHVQALAVRTIGLGGDSEVRHDAHGWHVGPQRVWPVCRLDEAAGAEAAAACLAWVQTHAGAEAGSQVICARMPGGANPDGLDERRQMILRLLETGPMTIGRLIHETRCLRPGFLGIELLVERQLVRFFGFTPTDALHIQGQLAMWNTDYARRYAEAIGAAGQLDAEAVSRRVIDQVEYTLARELLMTRLADCCGEKGLDHDHGALARALLDRGLGRVRDGLGVAFDLGVPVIGIGAPAAFLLPAAAGRLRAEVIIPRDGDVANAVGAITSQVRVERQVVIVPDELGRLHVNGLPGAPTFTEIAEAQAFAERELTHWVLRLAREAGARDPEATLSSDDRIVDAADGVTVFLNRTLRAVAAGGI
jgi:N-methylhydantoinase A/oxoprolinase/acetone carboxylase beta subunit